MSVKRVLKLHRPVKEQGYAMDCVNLACEHADDVAFPECPMVTFTVCGHCSFISNHGGPWEDLIPSEVMWPCETAKAAKA
jgi:hypothetical protein